MEYYIGVRSGKYSPPTYAEARRKKPYRKTRAAARADAPESSSPALAEIVPPTRPLQFSHISGTQIVIDYRDLQDNDWANQLRSRFEESVEMAGGPSHLGSLIPNGSLDIKYFGFVCPNCLGIGAMIKEEEAFGCNNGKHQCSLNLPESTSGFDKTSREKIRESLKREALPILLYTLVKVLSRGRSCKLCARRSSPINLPVTAIDLTFSEFEEAVQARRDTTLSDIQLLTFLKRARTTCGFAFSNDGSLIDVCLNVPV